MAQTGVAIEMNAHTVWPPMGDRCEHRIDLFASNPGGPDPKIQFSHNAAHGLGGGPQAEAPTNDGKGLAPRPQPVADNAIAE